MNILGHYLDCGTRDPEQQLDGEWGDVRVQMAALEAGTLNSNKLSFITLELLDLKL
jgi:hypothetical protein